jgi:DNA-binding Xre family transcriptional regulator
VQEAFSRLKSVLDRQGLSTADLIRRVQEQGDRINAKSIYRLADPEEPLEKVDMRVVGAVCQALEIGIGDLLTFDEPTIIEEFAPTKQARMDVLMHRHHEGADQGLSAPELAELQELVERGEVVGGGNVLPLANRRRRLLRGTGKRPSPPEENGHRAA